MSEDLLYKGLSNILKGVNTNMRPQLQRLFEKAKKNRATGKPKGRSPSMILGSSSKAGMQSKQGKRTRRPIPMTPRLKKR